MDKRAVLKSALTIIILYGFAYWFHLKNSEEPKKEIIYKETLIMDTIKSNTDEEIINSNTIIINNNISTK